MAAPTPALPADRTFALDERFLRRHRAGAEVALLLGGSVTLRAEAPRTYRASALDLPRGDGTARTTGERIAVVEITGPLAQRAEFGMCGGYVDGYDALAVRFLAALADPDVDAVVLRTDSPGGDVAGAEEGIRRMREAALATWKPVLASVDELAASAAAWVLAAVAKDGIFGPVAARFGSIASAVVLEDTSAEAEKTGRKVIIVRGLPGKMVPSGVEPTDELGRARMQARADATTGRFIGAVANVRDIEPAAIREMNADVFEMAAAKARGLVDGVESLEATISRAAKLARERKTKMDQRAELARLAGLPASASDAEIEAALPELERRVGFAASALALTGAATTEAAGGTIAAWQASHAALPAARAEAEASAAELVARTAAEEQAERVQLVSAVALALGPAVAYENPHEPPAARRPAAAYAAMPLAALRAHAGALAGLPPAMGGKKVAAGGNAPPALAGLPEAARAEADRLDPKDRAGFAQAYREMWGARPAEEEAR